MNKSLQALIAETKSTIAKLYAWRNIPHHVEFISLLDHADGLLGLFELHGFDRYTVYYRFSMVILRFRRKCYLVKFSDEFAPHHCRICSVPTGTSFRVCSGCMAAGHIRQQERARNGALSHVLPKPRPRRPLETEHQETASQRFLRRFSAPTTLATPTTLSRAMKNRLFTASQPLKPLSLCSDPSARCFSPSFPSLPSPATCSNLNPKHQPQPQNLSFPPAYVPSPKVAGVFSSPAPALSFRFVRWVNLEGAVLVTPPLCPMGGTFRTKNDQVHCFSGQCFGGLNAD